MKKSNLGYVMAIVTVVYILTVESGFASVKTFENGETALYNSAIDSAKVKSSNTEIENNLSLPVSMDGMSVSTAFKDQIKYPLEALNSDIEGIVRVECIIGRDGYVSHVKILKSDDESLANEVAKAVRNVRFKPAMVNGTPHNYSVIVPVRFELK
jgi:periplasmic protein TonB